MDATYVSAGSFKVSGDRTAEFVANRRIKANCVADGIKYATVISGSYSAPDTTVFIDESTLTSNLLTVLYGIVSPGEFGSLPDHAHDGSEGSGGELTVSGSGASTLLELTDTPDVYDDGKFLQSTAVGTEWATVTGAGGGTSDHSALNELDYASSGHTGFASTADLSTTSGTLQSQIDGLDYYTTAEVDTISGTLQTQIDGKSDTSHIHDDRYYTETEVDTISGSLSAEIDSDISTHAASADHDGRYYTESEIDTISGSLQTNIDAKPDTLLELTDTPAGYDDDKYLKSTASGTEWATVSGAGGGASTLLELTDTPDTYDDGKYLQSTTSGTEWATLDTVASDFAAYELVQEWNIDNTTFSGTLDWDGETDDRVLIELINLATVTAGPNIRINYDQGNNYKHGWYRQNAGNMEVGSSTGSSFIQILSGYRESAYVRIEAALKNTGNYRGVLIDEASHDTGNENRMMHSKAAFWTNTSSDVTSLTIYCEGNMTGTIRVYRFGQVNLPSGAQTFLDLSDTPSDYGTTSSGSAGNYLMATSSGIEYREFYYYGTGDPPTVSGLADGVLYFKYTA